MAKQQAAIAKQESKSLAEMPEYLKPKPGSPRLGNENVTPEDVIVPRLQLCQSNNPELKKSHSKHIPGLEQGMFFNTATREIYGREVRLINAHYFRSRTRWEEPTIGAPILCRSSDGVIGVGDPGIACAQCEYSKFKDEDKDTRPECTTFMNFPSLVIGAGGAVDLTQIVVVSFKSLAIKAGKNWNTLVNIRNADRFAGVYKLTSVEDHRESGDSYQPAIENDGWATEQQYKSGRAVYEMIQALRAAGRMQVEQESETVAV